MTFLCIAVHITICIWLIWFKGAEALEGHFATIFFFYPGMTVQELKVYAAISLLTMPIYIFLI